MRLVVIHIPDQRLLLTKQIVAIADKLFIIGAPNMELPYSLVVETPTNVCDLATAL